MAGRHVAGTSHVLALLPPENKYFAACSLDSMRAGGAARHRGLAFANEVAGLAEDLDVDVGPVLEGIGTMLGSVMPTRPGRRSSSRHGTEPARRGRLSINAPSLAYGAELATSRHLAT